MTEDPARSLKDLDRDLRLTTNALLAMAMPGRWRRWWRDALLAATVLAVMALGVAVLTLASKPPPALVGTVLWTNPDTGVTYRCILLPAADGEPPPPCTPWR